MDGAFFVYSIEFGKYISLWEMSLSAQSSGDQMVWDCHPRQVSKVAGGSLLPSLAILL